MSVHPLGPRPDMNEEAVHHPELRALVHAARGQVAPTVGIAPEALHAAWRQRRTRRRALVAGGVAAAALLAVAAGNLLPSPEPDRGTPDSRSVVKLVPSQEPTVEASDHTAEPRPAAPPRLEEAIELAALGEITTPAEILGPHRLRVHQGRWSIDSRSPSPVRVDLPDGRLELRGAHVHVEVAGDVSRMEVLRAEVVRFDVQGRRVPEVEPPAPPEPRRTSPNAATADDLAREAEAQMAAGSQRQAIATLRKLVTLHPRSAAARSGLIDLGRLLEGAGQTDEARCAYALFLQRFAGHALGGDVAKAQRALGEGPACRGLRPRR